MNPLARACAIFPPPKKPIFNMLVSISNGTFFFISSISAKSLSLTVTHYFQYNSNLLNFNALHSYNCQINYNIF